MTGNHTTTGRIIFLDVDGTFADHGVVPEAHQDLVRAARARGHRVLLCTGRPMAMLPERILAAGFDGVVASAGGYVVVGGQVLADRRFPADLAARAVRVLTRHDVAYVLEAPEALYGPSGVDQRLARLMRGRLGGGADDHEGPRDILDRLDMTADLATASFGKITCFDSDTPLSQVTAEMAPGASVLPSSIPGMGDRAGEIFLTGVHKAVGIQAVIEHLGVDRSAVVAAGDGPNDLEMLEFADTAIAIEGSDPQLLAHADLIVPGPARHGLTTAFTQLGLV